MRCDVTNIIELTPTEHAPQWRINGVPSLRRRVVEAPNKSAARAIFKAMLHTARKGRLPTSCEVYRV